MPAAVFSLFYLPIIRLTEHFKYLNSGGFIGKAGFIKNIFNEYPIFSTVFDGKYSWSNQYYWTYVYLQNLNNVKIDYQCELFYTTAMQSKNLFEFNLQLKNKLNEKKLFNIEKNRLDKEISIHNKRITNLLTKTHPCHLHCPGPASKLLFNEGYFNGIKVN